MGPRRNYGPPGTPTEHDFEMGPLWPLLRVFRQSLVDGLNLEAAKVGPGDRTSGYGSITDRCGDLRTGDFVGEMGVAQAGQAGSVSTSMPFSASDRIRRFQVLNLGYG